MLSAVSKSRQALAAGRTIVGHWHCSGCPLLAETVSSSADYDVVVVDMQHGIIDATAAMAVLASVRSAAPFVRLRDLAPSHIHHCLDAGALGLIAPLINSVSDAEAFVRESRYPPDGTRSFGPVRAGLLAADYFGQADTTIMRWAMIETKPALDNAKAIAAVDGIDGLFIGPNDLSLALGVGPTSAPTDPCVVDGPRGEGHTGGRGEQGGIHDPPLTAPPCAPSNSDHAHPGGRQGGREARGHLLR